MNIFWNNAVCNSQAESKTKYSALVSFYYFHPFLMNEFIKRVIALRRFLEGVFGYRLRASKNTQNSQKSAYGIKKIQDTHDKEKHRG